MKTTLITHSSWLKKYRKKWQLLIPFLLITINASSQAKTFTVYFQFGANSLPQSEQTKLLQTITDSIADKSKFTININGYCDHIDQDLYNDTLSLQRAEYIRDLLFKNGIKPQQVKECKGLGEKTAVNSEEESARKYDRRVDITFMPLGKYAHTSTSKNVEVKILKDSITAEDFIAGKTLVIDNLNFQPGRHFLLERSIPTLKQLIIIMHENPNLEIEIVGHICCQASTINDAYDIDTHLFELSLNRAKHIYDYLVKSGISESRLSYTGKGASQKLVEPERSAEDEEANRRVEIIVKKS